MVSRYDGYKIRETAPRGGGAVSLLIYSFNSQPKAYSAALTVRLRLTVKRNAVGKAPNQQPARPAGTNWRR